MIPRNFVKERECTGIFVETKARVREWVSILRFALFEEYTRSARIIYSSINRIWEPGALLTLLFNRAR